LPASGQSGFWHSLMQLVCSAANAARYAEMGELYAEDSVWRRPPPVPEVRGRELIAAGYASPEQALSCQGMQVAATRYLVDGSTVAAELVSARPRPPGR
jgi:hypothetical protein